MALPFCKSMYCVILTGNGFDNMPVRYYKGIAIFFLQFYATLADLTYFCLTVINIQSLMISEVRSLGSMLKLAFLTYSYSK